MPRKPIGLPPEVAEAFVADMRAYFAEKNAIKRDEIAGRQMSVLRRYQGPREKPVRIPDIKDMFRQMMDEHDRLVALQPLVWRLSCVPCHWGAGGFSMKHLLFALAALSHFSACKAG